MTHQCVYLHWIVFNGHILYNFMEFPWLINLAVSWKSRKEHSLGSVPLGVTFAQPESTNGTSSSNPKWRTLESSVWMHSWKLTRTWGLEWPESRTLYLLESEDLSTTGGSGSDSYLEPWVLGFCYCPWGWQWEFMSQSHYFKKLNGKTHTD